MYKRNVAWEAPIGYAPTGGTPTSWIQRFTHGTVNAVLTVKEMREGHYYSREHGITTLDTDEVRSNAMKYWGDFFMQKGLRRNIPSKAENILIFNEYLRNEMEQHNNFCMLPLITKIRYQLHNITHPKSEIQLKQEEDQYT